jgi:uncharacterized protein (TIGR03086 family)
MDAKQLYQHTVETASKVVRQVQPEDMELPTPDTEWNVHDLLRHIVYELAWTADIVSGRTIEEVGDKYDSDLLNADPVQVWEHYETLAHDAVGVCDEQTTAHLSYADKPVGEYLFEAGNDQLIHAWDLGEAIGVPVVFDEGVADILYERARGRVDEFVGSGLFAAPISVPESSDAQTKLLAILGRSTDWNERA